MKLFRYLLLSLVAITVTGCAHNFIDGNEPALCNVHQVPLSEIIVPLEFGLPIRPSDDYLKAKEKLFPNSRLYENGGCTIGLREMLFPNQKAKVLACHVCNQTEEEWLKTTTNTKSYEFISNNKST